MIPAARIVAIAPAAAPYAAELVRQMAEAGIMANPSRASMFLGQVAHECSGFTAMVENLNYSSDGLANTWPSRYAKRDSSGGYVRVMVKGRKRYLPNTLGNSLARNPEAIANNAYADRMGNGPQSSGDGWRYRGRGAKMVTGKDNYRAFSRFWLGDDSLLANPGRVADPDGAVASAVWFWMTRKLNEVADRGDVSAVTQIVNGGLIGLDSRKLWTQRFREAWVDNPFANVVSMVTSTEDRA